MKFAHFSHIWGKSGVTPHQRYEQLWRELQLCDELGFDHGFCVEHHFRPDESLWREQPFSFHGDSHRTDSAQISVQPLQRPHPPIWMMSRDPQTLEFCTAKGIYPGYFLVYPRADASPRYRKFLEDWNKAGWPRKPNIAYCMHVFAALGS